MNNTQQLVDFVLEISCQEGDLDAESNGMDAYDSLLESARSNNDQAFYKEIMSVDRNEFAKLYEKELEKILTDSAEQWEREHPAMSY